MPRERPLPTNRPRVSRGEEIPSATFKSHQRNSWPLPGGLDLIKEDTSIMFRYNRNNAA